MDLWQSASGMVSLRITSADPSGILSVLHRDGIVMHRVSMPDEMTLLLTVRRQDVKQLRRLLKNKGVDIRAEGYQGLYWTLRSFGKRPVLLGGLAFLLALGIFLPTRVFFFRVEGNVTVPTHLILEQADACGLRFGASRRTVRSEKVKNALLEAVPQLQWAGVNTSGCIATISVKERQAASPQNDIHGVTSIVATRDGIIRELTVTSGSATCKVGQAVKAGQTLVSGYTDCGISIRAERAKGEVFALTERKISAAFPMNWMYRGENCSATKKYALIIGKKRINFYKGSGILDTGCVKMYEEKFLTLPGGLRLPLAIVTEVWINTAPSSVSISFDETQLSELARKYLQRTMIAGQILSKYETASREDDLFRLEGVYECLEMIGMEQSEEIIEP